MESNTTTKEGKEMIYGTAVEAGKFRAVKTKLDGNVTPIGPWRFTWSEAIADIHAAGGSLPRGPLWHKLQRMKEAACGTS